MTYSQTAAHKASTDPRADFDAIIIGAGMSGMYQLYRLRELGMRVRVFEAGTGVGGTWYWNRYPGARFDSASWTYGYSFSQELLEEWDWEEHFAGQPETERYLNYVADKFDLRRDIQLNSRVTAARYDEDKRSWEVELENGRRYSARFLVTAVGVLSAATMPTIPGVKTFQGQSCHTHYWPKEPVRFEGKRVAVIGTGATGVQTITEVAKTAGHLTVFQRTPQWCAPLHNAKIGNEEMNRIRANYTEIFARCQETYGCFIHAADPRATHEVTQEEREAFWEKLYGEPGFGIWMGNFRDILTDEEANAAISVYVAKKIRQRVKDPKVADKLIPKDHGFGTRRVPLESGYFETYNRDNVTLIDTIVDEPIECITPQGIKTARQEHELHILVYATGFDGVTGPYDRIDIRGENGLRLKDAWAETPRPYLGMLAEGFPNMLMGLGPHPARGNIIQAISHSVEFQAGLLRFMQQHNYTHVETRPQKVDEWTRIVIKAGEGLLSFKVDSWQNGVNRNVDGRTVRRVLGYNGNGAHFRRTTDEVAKGGYHEFAFR